MSATELYRIFQSKQRAYETLKDYRDRYEIDAMFDERVAENLKGLQQRADVEWKVFEAAHDELRQSNPAEFERYRDMLQGLISPTT